MELGLYAGQYDFSERALLPWTRQLRPGTSVTRAAPTRQKQQHQICTEWDGRVKIINYWFHAHMHILKNTRKNPKVCLASLHTQGCLGHPVSVSIRHRKSQTCNGDDLYLYLGPLSGVICRASLSSVSSGNRKRALSFSTARALNKCRLIRDKWN